MTFTDYVTPVPADWLNNVNTVVNTPIVNTNLYLNTLATPANHGFFTDYPTPSAPVIWNQPDRARFGIGWQATTRYNPDASSPYFMPQYGWQEREASNYTLSSGRLAVSGISWCSKFIPVYQAQVVASITDTVMTVTAVNSGFIQVSQLPIVAGLPTGTYVLSFGTGTGGVGTYNLTTPAPSPIASTTINLVYQPSGIGVNGLVLNDDTTFGSQGWGIYGEAYRVQGAGPIYAMELNVGEGSIGGVFNNPYTIGGNASVGILMNAGGSTGAGYADSSSAALIIGNNGNKFASGIIVNSNALSGAVVPASALSMATGHSIDWYSAAGNVAATIRSDITTGGGNKHMLFNNTSIGLGNNGFNESFIFSLPINGANGFQFSSTAAGTGLVEISAQGPDANIDLGLSPKAGGVLRYEIPFNAGAPTATGYVFFKTSDGVLRKLLVG